MKKKPLNKGFEVSTITLILRKLQLRRWPPFSSIPSTSRMSANCLSILMALALVIQEMGRPWTWTQKGHNVKSISSTVTPFLTSFSTIRLFITDHGPFRSTKALSEINLKRNKEILSLHGDIVKPSLVFQARFIMLETPSLFRFLCDKIFPNRHRSENSSSESGTSSRTSFVSMSAIQRVESTGRRERKVRGNGEELRLGCVKKSRREITESRRGWMRV